MADEYVSMAQFGEFVKRMEAGFAHVNQLADQRYDSINQRLADAEKAREQNLVHVNQRFDDMNQRFDDMNQRFDDMNQRFDDTNQRFDDMHRSVNQRFDDTNRSMDRRFDSLEKMIAWQNRITMGILLVILAAAVKYLFLPG